MMKNAEWVLVPILRFSMSGTPHLPPMRSCSTSLEAEQVLKEVSVVIGGFLNVI
jgi:hypothetical protein